MSLKTLHDLASVIDYEALLNRCLNNLDFAESMLALFQGHGGEELAEIERACSNGNMQAVSQIAHRFHGACANVAAHGLQARVTELRTAVLDGASEKTTHCLAELQREWQRFITAVATPQ